MKHLEKLLAHQLDVRGIYLNEERYQEYLETLRITIDETLNALQDEEPEEDEEGPLEVYKEWLDMHGNY